MKRRLLGTLVLAVLFSITVWGAAVWVGSQYIETFQNGMLFGNANILKVSNSVPEFEDASGNVKRMDLIDANIIKIEDFESDIDASDFLCGANLTASNETTAPISGITSVDIDQGGTAASAGIVCDSQPVTLSDKHQGKFVGACFYSTWDGNDNEMAVVINDNTNSTELGEVLIRASTEPLEHCVYFNTETNTASVDYDIEVQTGNDNTTLRIDDFQFKVDPLTPTDIYASSEWESYTPTLGGWSGLDSNSLRWRRDGSDILIQGNFNPTSGAASEAQLGLPSGLTVDSGVTGPMDVGSYVIGPTGANQSRNGGRVFATAGDTYVNFSSDAIYSGTVNQPLSFKNADAGVAPLDQHAIKIRVPIAGWSDTAQGVVVKNRSDSASVENVFTAQMASDGTISGENIDFIDGNCVNGATGNYDCNFKAGFFSANPSCHADATDAYTADAFDPDTDDYVFYTYTRSSNPALGNHAVRITCVRAGTDYIKETDKVYTVPIGFKESEYFTSEIQTNFWDGTGNQYLWDVSLLDTTGSTTIEVVDDFASAGGLATATIVRAKQNIDIAVTVGNDINNNNMTIYNSSGGIIALSGSNSTPVYSAVSATIKLAKDDYIFFRTPNANQRAGFVTIWAKPSKEEGVFLGTFGQPTCYVKDVKAAASTGGTATSGSFLPRVLNTLEGQCSFASLSSGTTGTGGTATDLTLESGSYNIECGSPFSFVVNDVVTRLRNTSDGSTAIVSMSRRAGAADDNINSTLMGNVTISGSKTFQLQYRVGTTRSTDGLGHSISFGENNVFAQCKVTKVR